ncbi:MAG: riboflavin synthase [Thermoleophilaceae bacterium]|nr:riboflavin synthase [Thermoleophilaceae bacterium]
MFTGLVQTTGTVTAFESGRLSVFAGPALELSAGGSVAVSGVCLTATAVRKRSFDADVVGETLRRTSLGALRAGDTVNLELPLRAGEPLGGHMVQGHVDGTGTVETVDEDTGGGAAPHLPGALGRTLRIAAEADILRYVVEKGSITVDGVSLTVAAVGEDSFSLALIPETLERTTLGAAAAGTRVNIEVDVLAKYVEKLVSRGAQVA